MRRSGIRDLIAVGVLAAAAGACGHGNGVVTTAGTSVDSSPASTTRSIGSGIRPIATMRVPRAVQTATALDDGRVLVAGGCTDAGCDVGGGGGRTAELFDPLVRRFTPTGSLLTSRDDHTATLLADDRVLLAGGWGLDDGAPGVLGTSELYDPRSGSFSTGPGMRSPRAGFTATRLEDGRVLVAGGFTSNEQTVRTAELFDPRSNRFVPTGPMNAARGAHAAVLLRDGRVLVLGGLGDGGVLDTAELYDPATGRFTLTGRMGTSRYKTSAITLTDGTVLVVGGSADHDGTVLYRSTELYDPRSGRFRAGADMGEERYKLTQSLVRLDDGQVLVAGGAASAELYDPVRRRFAAVSGTLDGPRLFLTATNLGNGEALLLGGYDQRITPTAQAWLYAERATR